MQSIQPAVATAVSDAVAACKCGAGAPQGAAAGPAAAPSEEEAPARPTVAPAPEEEGRAAAQGAAATVVRHISSGIFLAYATAYFQWDAFRDRRCGCWVCQV